jgi:hypothetical protein
MPRLAPKNMMPRSRDTGAQEVFHQAVPTLCPRGGGNPNLGGRPDLPISWFYAWLTVAGQCWTFTSFAFKPSHPGVQVPMLTFYLIIN